MLFEFANFDFLPVRYFDLLKKNCAYEARPETNGFTLEELNTLFARAPLVVWYKKSRVDYQSMRDERHEAAVGHQVPIEGTVNQDDVKREIKGV